MKKYWKNMRDFVPLGIVHKTVTIPLCPFCSVDLLCLLHWKLLRTSQHQFVLLYMQHTYMISIYLSKKSENTERVQLYENGYKHFCKTVIEEKLLKKQQVFRLSKLDMLFVHVVQERKGVNIATYTRLAHSLKARLQKSHPCNFEKYTQHSL